ncbi:Phage integrase family protein [compost metagenome]
MRESNFAPYRRAIYAFGVLHEINLPAPSVAALMEAAQFTPKYSTPGRFRTLPTTVVFNAIRNAIEFHLEHGESLTKAFCRIALECKKRKISPSSLTQDEVRTLVGKKLENLGISKISLASRFANFGQGDISIKGEKTEYFKNLRGNSGLLELIAIYTGGIQLTVGALMGRRVSELQELNASNCLDESELWLIFRNAKSTRHLFGHRRREARPIEPIAADMIKTLIRMQMILKRIGYIRDTQTLFSTPNLTGAASLTNCNPHMYNRNLDLFCDYFETPLNNTGERYYIRQHQLRRFFAMLFFYCGSFSKLDTLQWMLGHTDPKHIYHYITESTEGVVLAGAKAHYVAEQLHQGNVENYQELSDLLMKKYGTNDFNLIDTNDLEDQIQDLMSEGWLEIEPEFFTDHQGQKFKVVARLTREGAA